MKKPKPKRVPMGKPLTRPSEKQAEAESLPSQQDVQSAADWWRELAPAGYEGLLYAKKDDE